MISQLIQRTRDKVMTTLRRKLEFPSEELGLARLKNLGFAPEVLIDVGASDGPFVDEARRFWPMMSAYCFEPDTEYVEVLRARSHHDSRLKVCASLVGAQLKAEVPYFHTLGASTVLEEAPGPCRTMNPVRTAPMTTLDHYCAEHRVRPDFLKIDVQGYELEVLKGAEAVLPSIEVIFTEVNHIEIYQGAPLAAELIAWLAQRGYALHDICNFFRRPMDAALWQTDMIFVRQASKLRASKYWA